MPRENYDLAQGRMEHSMRLAQQFMQPASGRVKEGTAAPRRGYPRLSGGKFAYATPEGRSPTPPGQRPPSFTTTYKGPEGRTGTSPAPRPAPRPTPTPYTMPSPDIGQDWQRALLERILQMYRPSPYGRVDMFQRPRQMPSYGQPTRAGPSGRF